MEQGNYFFTFDVKFLLGHGETMLLYPGTLRQQIYLLPDSIYSIGRNEKHNGSFDFAVSLPKMPVNTICLEKNKE